jgi:diguanylate cyclase (GGDEF)-like protein
MDTPAEGLDTLTGAFLRAALEPRFDLELSAARQTGRPIALCMIDVDHFKSINDAFGHARGDEVLAAVAGRVRGAIRAGDLLFRYGGDEFVLLLPGSPEDHAANLAHRLLGLVQAAPVAGNPPVSVSLSIGIAMLEPADDSYLPLLKRADARVYTAKRLGRGRVVAADASPRGQINADTQSRLLERDVAMGKIHAFLADVAGVGRAMLTIHGPSGSGRSRLLGEAARAAELRGFTVLRIAGHGGTRNRLYGALFEVAVLRLAFEGVESRPDALAAAIAGWLTTTGRNGLFAAVDDLAELDAGTIAVLAALLRLPKPATITLAIVQADAGSARGLLHPAIAGTVEVTPFSEAGVRLWLRGALASEPPNALVTWLHEETGGLPAPLDTLTRKLVGDGHLHYSGSEWVWRQPTRSSSAGRNARTSTALVPLPSTWDTFVGRVAEIQALKDALVPRALVSVVGPGGVGKTRLALQVASELKPHFRDGVVFVALGGVLDEQHASIAAAAALGLTANYVDDPPASIVEFLAPLRMLLVFDDLDAAVGWTLLTEMRHLPELTVLVTAREPLHVPGEHILRLGGLDLPASTTASGFWSAAAVHLLVQRVRATHPGWEPIPDDYNAVAQICGAVEGMPLGLELAAAWVPALGCQEVAALIANGGHAAGQQGDLFAVLTAFWGELSPTEQQILRALCTFSDGFSVTAAMAVAGASRFLLTALVDRAFVHLDGKGRYDLHALLRQYGVEQLAAHQEELVGSRDRHLAHFLAVARQACPHLRGPEQARWLGVLEMERDNIRAALQWATEPARDGGDALELATLLAPFWRLRGPLPEGRGWLARALTVADAPAALRAQALREAGALAHFAGDLTGAAELLLEAIAALRAETDATGQARALSNLGMVRNAQGDPGAALMLYREAIVLLQGQHSSVLTAAILNNMGLASWRQGDLRQAAEWFDQCIAIERDLGDHAGIADSLDNLGCIHATRGEDAQAAVLFAEALAAHKDLADPQGEARSLANLAELALRRGDLRAAGEQYRASLRLCRQFGSTRSMVARIEGLALVAAGESAHTRAATLLASADTWRARLGTPLTADERAVQGRTLEHIRQTLSQAGYDAAEAVGRALEPDEAVALALMDGSAACIA